jgi:hypothetical protein
VALGGYRWRAIATWRTDAPPIAHLGNAGLDHRAEAAKAPAALDRPLVELPQPITAEAITRWSGGYLAYPPLVREEALDSTIKPDEERVIAHREAQRGFAASRYTGAERAARSQRVSLCMIVKNEAEVIERCFASVRHLIDHWVICDTGSPTARPR